MPADIDTPGGSSTSSKPPDATQQPCTSVDDPDIFFPAGRDPLFAEPALALCRRCMVVRECLSYALLHDVAGVWGGTTERRRADLRAQHNIQPLPVSLDDIFEESA